jgi:Ca-activated chloride channel family protein
MTQLPAFAFLWPKMLWLLLLVPLFAWLYVRHDRRRRRAAVLYPALQMVGVAAQASSRWRRHAPVVLMLLSLAALLLAMARPQATLRLPSQIQDVILAMDTSGSMRAEDVKPNRMQAAREAAKIFLNELPDGVRVGVVSLAGTAAVAHAPSRGKDEVATAIDRLQPQAGTALGNGLVIALATLLPQAGIDAEKFARDNSAEGAKKGGKDASANARAGSGLPAPPGLDLVNGDSAPVEPGSYKSGAIVLLSDGESNTGPDATKAAQLAAQHGVRIYTVGIGTPEGIVITVDGMSARVKLDEATLKKVADMTYGDYFRAEDAGQLKKVYQSLSSRLAYDRREMMEVTALFAALGALLAGCAAVLSLWWFGRIL